MSSPSAKPTDRPVKRNKLISSTRATLEETPTEYLLHLHPVGESPDVIFTLSCPKVGSAPSTPIHSMYEIAKDLCLGHLIASYGTEAAHTFYQALTEKYGGDHWYIFLTATVNGLPDIDRHALRMEADEWLEAQNDQNLP